MEPTAQATRTHRNELLSAIAAGVVAILLVVVYVHRVKTKVASQTPTVVEQAAPLPTTSSPQIPDPRRLSELVPAGKVACSIAVDPVTSFSHNIVPGDRVDIYATLDGRYPQSPKSSLVASNVLVLAVGPHLLGEASSKDAGDYNSVTVAIDPPQSERLLRAKLNAKIDFALRPRKAHR